MHTPFSLLTCSQDSACGKRSAFSMLIYFPVCHLCLPVFAFYSDLQTTVLCLRAVCLLGFYSTFSVTQRAAQGLAVALSKPKKARCHLKRKRKTVPVYFHAVSLLTVCIVQSFFRKLFDYSDLCNIFLLLLSIFSFSPHSHTLSERLQLWLLDNGPWKISAICKNGLF